LQGGSKRREKKGGRGQKIKVKNRFIAFKKEEKNNTELSTPALPLSLISVRFLK